MGALAPMTRRPQRNPDLGQLPLLAQTPAGDIVSSLCAALA